MKKLFMYDNRGFYLIACEFAGVNECGDPQMVVFTPGEPVTSLESFMKEEEIAEMRLLGEEGQPVTSLRVVRMLSPLLKYQDDSIISDLIDQMDRMGIEWPGKSVEMSVIVSKTDDEEVLYTLHLVLHDNERAIRFKNEFGSLQEIMECLRVFYHTLEDKASIHLKMKLHFTRHCMPIIVPEEYKTMFDVITYPDEE